MRLLRSSWFRLMAGLALAALLLGACSQSLPASTVSPSAGPTRRSAPTPTSALPTPPAALVSPHTCAPFKSPPLALDSSGDPYYPSLGDAGYDALHYSLDLSVDPLANTLQGTASIDATAIQDLATFDLDFHGLSIDALQVNDLPAAYERTDDKLSITPASPLPAGQAFTIRIRYHGTPDKVRSPALDLSLGWLHTSIGNEISAFGEPEGAQTWYPVNNHPCDKATYSLRVTVPKPFLVASNGLLVETLDQDTASSTLYHWENRHPTASYLVTVVIGDFAVQTQTGPHNLPIRNYFPKNLADFAAPLFEKTPDMIAYFESVFGPYPFDAYGVAVVDTYLDTSALETQTLSIFDVLMVKSNSISGAVPHELAHQWFGDSVTLDNWQDIWLNEGFATYAEVLWQEHSQGKLAANNYLQEMHRALSSTSQPTPPAPGLPPATDLFNFSVYYRGALTLNALRHTVGDEAFFAILKTYASRFRYGNSSTADFESLAEELSGQKLGPLFQAWLYEPDLPPMP